MEIINKLLEPLGVRVTRRWLDLRPTFSYRGRPYETFIHGYNCGWPPAPMTERSIELAIADRWLDEQSADVLEIGAVTPYYWPGRLTRIVDPVDTHPRVSDHSSIFDVDVTNQSVLCLSTLEHIGQTDYGLEAFTDGPAKALAHLEQAAHYLITVPYGVFEPADRTFFDEPLPRAVYLTRDAGSNLWREAPVSEVRQPYAPYPRERARGLAVLEK